AVISNGCPIACFEARNVGELIFSYEASAPNFGGTKLQLPSDAISHSLQYKCSIWSTSATNRCRRNHVSHHHVESDVERLQRIRPWNGCSGTCGEDEPIR